MKYFILAVLLAVMQAGPPIPRKATDASAGRGQNVTQNSKTNQNTLSARSAIPQATPQNQAKSQPPTDTNTQETIVIRESAPMPPASADWWFRAYVIFTGALVAIGAVGICYAIKTLNAIKRQAKANEDQLTEIQQSSEKTDRMILIAAQEAENSKIATQAAKASADALVNSERAWILVNLEGGMKGDDDREFFITEGFSSEKGKSTTLRADVMLANQGKSPCWIIDLRLKFEIVEELPDAPSLESAIAQDNCAGTSFASEDVHKFIWNDTFYGRGTSSNVTVAYGIVNYKDIFGLPRSTTFGFKIVRDDLIGGWHYAERLSPAYNEHK